MNNPNILPWDTQMTSNWNYICYYRLDNPANVAEVESQAFQYLKKTAPGQTEMNGARTTRKYIFWTYQDRQTTVLRAASAKASNSTT